MKKKKDTDYMYGKKILSKLYKGRIRDRFIVSRIRISMNIQRET